MQCISVVDILLLFGGTIGYNPKPRKKEKKSILKYNKYLLINKLFSLVFPCRKFKCKLYNCLPNAVIFIQSNLCIGSDTVYPEELVNSPPLS